MSSRNLTKRSRREQQGRLSARRQEHTIDPFYTPESEILILGSFPSVRSRAVGFFYGHPQNRFWSVLAGVFDEKEVPDSIEEKKAFLARNKVALWDSIASCTITGSSDSSIRDVVPNPVGDLLTEAPVRKIICNGAASYRIYHEYIEKTVGREAVRLPSTSPANAAWTADRLLDAWREGIGS